MLDPLELGLYMVVILLTGILRSIKGPLRMEKDLEPLSLPFSEVCPGLVLNFNCGTMIPILGQFVET